jgi:excisionase family DNA binding protein
MTELSQDERLLISVREAANILSLGKSTIWALIARGDLQTTKIGRTRRITIESVRALARPAMPPT